MRDLIEPLHARVEEHDDAALVGDEEVETTIAIGVCGVCVGIVARYCVLGIPDVSENDGGTEVAMTVGGQVSDGGQPSGAVI
jgi:hypothetical protein